MLNRFEKHVSRFGVIYFEEGTKEEHDFKKILKSQTITTNRSTVLKCTGKDLYRHPYHYLSARPERRDFDYKYFMNYNNVCKGGGDLLCQTNLIQKNKVVIDLKKPLNFDIVEIPGILKPKIHIVSRRLKEIIDTSGLTGYKLVPCLEKGKDYSKEETHFEIQSNKLEKEANYFQLVVTDEVKIPDCIGKITRIFSQCTTCNAVYGFLSDSDSYFKDGDLMKTDFQRSGDFRTSNGKIIRSATESIIISSKVLKLFIDNKVKGLFRYMTDPPIKYGVVEIR